MLLFLSFYLSFLISLSLILFRNFIVFLNSSKQLVLSSVTNSMFVFFVLCVCMSIVLYFTDPIRCERLCLHLLTSSLLLLSRPSFMRI